MSQDIVYCIADPYGRRFQCSNPDGLKLTNSIHWAGYSNISCSLCVKISVWRKARKIANTSSAPRFPPDILIMTEGEATPEALEESKQELIRTHDRLRK